MRLRTLLLVALLSTSTLAAASWRAADQSVDVIVLGVPYLDVAPAPTRAAALADFDARATPFFASLDAIVPSLGGTVVATWSFAPAAHVRIPASALPILSAQPGVRAVVPDAPDAIRAEEPTEPIGTQNTGGRQLIQAEEAWAMGYQGQGVKIALLSTGIDDTHEAFRNADGSSRLVAWRDLVNARPTPYDDQGQGTGMMASAAGSSWYDHPTYGAFQEAGVAPRAALLAAKFLDSTGSGSFANAIAALEWSFAQGADITLNGWGSGCTSSALPILQSFRTLTDAGMLSVVTVGAGGPSPGTIAAPACGESLISVGGLGAGNVVYGPSGRGPCSDPELPGPSRICPDLVAKAANVRTAAARGTCGLCNDSGYRTHSVSSAAAAFVAGGVALIEEMKRTLTGEGWNTSAREEEAILKATALDLGPEGPDDSYGWGLPQIMGVHAVLAAPPHPVITGALSATPTLLRDGQTATLSFSVLNLGTGIASGTFLVTRTEPDGDVVTLTQRAATLGLLDRASSAHTLAASSAEPGIHTLAGTFAYSWTDPETGEVVHDTYALTTTFEVRRLVVAVDLTGLDVRTSIGDVQHATLAVANRGNEDARNTSVRLTIPDDYLALPPAPFDPTHPNGRYASPAPDEVHEDANFGRVTLVWRVGDLPAGEEREFSLDLVPTTPGRYRFLAVALHCDAGGICGQTSANADQVITLPTP